MNDLTVSPGSRTKKYLPKRLINGVRVGNPKLKRLPSSLNFLMPTATWLRLLRVVRVK